MDARRNPSLTRLLVAAIVGAALTVVAAPVASAAPTLAVFSGSSFALGNPSTSVRIADVTGDGLNDLIASSPGVNTITVVAQQADPDHTLSVAASLPTDGTAPTLLLATGDLNGDGTTDLAAGTDVGLDVWRQASGSLVGTKSLVATATPVHGVAIADLNGDGRDDLVWAQVSATTGYDYEVAYQNVSNTLDAAAAIGTGDAATFAVGDVDADGRPDLVLEDATAAGVDELLQTSAGIFTPAIDTGALGASSAAVADVNGDTVPDLVTTGGEDVEVQLGDGSGGLSGAATYPIPWGTVASVGVADLNGDGLLDVVAAGDWSTHVLLQTADGTLVDGGDWAPLGSPADGDAALAIGDLNEDGLPDLAAASATDEVGLLTQLGPGPRLDSSLTMTPSTTSIAVGQKVTFTGTLTLATAYLGTPAVSIHQRLPDGTTSIVAQPSLAAVPPGLGFGTFTYTAKVKPPQGGTLRYWARWATDAASATATSSPKVSIAVSKTPTSTTLASSSARIVYGGGAKLTARVQGGSGGSVTFFRIVKGVRKEVGTSALDSSGVATHKVQPGATTTYVASYSGSSVAKPSTANTVTVQVRVKIVAGMVREKSTDGAYAVYECCKAYYSFAVAPNHAGASVSANVEYRQGTSWKGLGSQSFTLRKDSTQVIYIKIGGGKGYRFRVKACFPSDTDHVGACSAFSYFSFK